MIVYRFKITFEDIDEVERFIDIRANQSFQDLYRIVVESIGFDPNINASFFISGDNWRKGKEISNNGKEGVATMANTRLNTQVNDPHQKILLVTHDEMEWTLRIQLFKIQKMDDNAVIKNLFKSVGEAPKQFKIVSIGKPTNEFEEMVDEIVRENESVDTSEMGFDDESGFDHNDSSEESEDDDMEEFDDNEDQDEGGDDSFYEDDED
ncbi:MAG: hypothetical protein GC181_05080 [Bacteroidetes bacterium]|nr:hypothetical protein [Bacteroidota bacterium]